MSDEAIAELQHVTKRYREGPAEAPWVLKDVDLSVAASESVAIVGPSGSGKSTLLNILGGLDAPTSGRALLEGQDLSTLDQETLARVRNRRIGFVFQRHHLLPQCTLLENVLVPTLVGGRNKSAPERAEKLLQRVGLAHAMHRRPGQLSGGECQRAAVVRALINRPALLLADEPTGSLDRAAAEGLADLLTELNEQEGVTLVVVTHSAELADRMERALMLRDGTLSEDSGGA